MLLNPAPQHIRDAPQPYYSKALQLEVLPVKTTLIVCECPVCCSCVGSLTFSTIAAGPEILRQQWRDEIKKHTPTRSLYNFTTRGKAEKDKPKEMTWKQWASGFDVIVVSFDSLRSEVSEGQAIAYGVANLTEFPFQLHVAKAERPRARRFDRKHEVSS